MQENTINNNNNIEQGTLNKWKKNATLFLCSQGITLFGSSVTQFAIIWYVTIVTGSGIWVSLLTVSAYLPQFLISFFSGVWADRYSKKKIIILSDTAIALTTLAFAILFPLIKTEQFVLWALVIVSVLRSIGTGIQTPAVSATIPLLVPQANLMKYNGINSTLQSIVQFAAPAVAGIVLTIAPFNVSMYIDVATAVVGISVLIAVAVPFAKNTQPATVFADIKMGIKYAAKQKFVGKILVLFGIFIFLCVPAGFMASLFVGRYYGNEYWQLSLVEIIGFAGMILGGIIISASGGFKNRVTTLTVGLTFFGLLAVGMGVVDNFIVYLILMSIYGIALTMVQTASTTLLQEKTSQEMLGRIFGLFGAVYSGSLPIGMLIFGALADVVSLRLIMAASGALLVLLAVVLFFDKKFILEGKPQKPPLATQNLSTTIIEDKPSNSQTTAENNDDLV